MVRGKFLRSGVVVLSLGFFANAQMALAAGGPVVQPMAGDCQTSGSGHHDGGFDLFGGLGSVFSSVGGFVHGVVDSRAFGDALSFGKGFVVGAAIAVGVTLGVAALVATFPAWGTAILVGAAVVGVAALAYGGYQTVTNWHRYNEHQKFEVAGNWIGGFAGGFGVGAALGRGVSDGVAVGLANAPRIRAVPFDPNPDGWLGQEIDPSGQAAVWGATSDQLSHATVVSSSPNASHGVMGSDIISIRLPTGRVVRAVFKPVDGERTWGQYQAGTLYVREIAASKLNDALGFRLVPPTVRFEVGGRPGSAQLFAEDGTRASLVSDQTRMNPVQREQMQVLDYLIVNSDRHGGNWLVRDSGGIQTPIAIDHGLSFPPNSNYGPAPTNLDPATRALLDQADPARVARALAEAGLDDPSIVGVLTRLGVVRAANGGAGLTPDQVNALVAAAHP